MLAKQMVRNLALSGCFRQLERVAWRDAMVDHHARQQEPTRVAAHLVNPAALPGQRDRAGDMIEQAGGAARIALIVAPAGYLAREADGAVGQFAQTVAPGL